MGINKEICTITKTKFQDIREELDREYYKPANLGYTTYDNKLTALKNAVDDLLTLLDKVVS